MSATRSRTPGLIHLLARSSIETGIPIAELSCDDIYPTIPLGTRVCQDATDTRSLAQSARQHVDAIGVVHDSREALDRTTARFGTDGRASPRRWRFSPIPDAHGRAARDILSCLGSRSARLRAQLE